MKLMITDQDYDHLMTILEAVSSARECAEATNRQTLVKPALKSWAEDIIKLFHNGCPLLRCEYIKEGLCDYPNSAITRDRMKKHGDICYQAGRKAALADAQAGILEYHKGEFCPYTKNHRVCQEGYCMNCIIKGSTEQKLTKKGGQ